jgi:photosystem II stability/assembly factor-like uncharacterized protein
MKFLPRLVPRSPLPLLFFLLAFASPLCATDYFVATNGNDNANNGLTAARPFRNIARAVTAALPGDTVTVAAGTYNETVSIPALRSGTVLAPITYRSVTRGAARIVGQFRILASNITISGFDIANPNQSGIIVSSDRVRILNNDIHNCSGHGISAVSFDYLTIEGNRLFRNGQQNSSQASGISLYQPVAADQAPGFHIIVRGNESFENDSVVQTQGGGTNFRVGIGIHLDDFRNTLEGSLAGVYRPATLIENNLLYGNVGRALVISLSDNITVRHNTAYNNLPLRNTITTLGDFSCSDTDGVRWVNNILVTRAPSLNAIFDARNTNSTWDYNVIWGGSLSIAADSTTVLGSHNYLLDPRLTAPDTNNFRPGPGSIAIDNGGSAFAAPTDFEGTARPIGSGVDIGAFETKPDLTAPSGIAPTLATQPVGQTLLPGGIVTLSVSPNGSPPLTYQWSRNGAAINGATAVAFTLSPIQSADAGVYDVRVTSPVGTITSNPAAIAVAVTPVFTFRNPTPALGTLLSVGFGAGKFLAVGIGGRIVTSPDAVNWSLAATLPTAAAPTTALRGIAHNGSLWVAVGDSGVIFTSPDTVVWTPRTSPTTQTLLWATYANNQFLACGNSGTILVSPDGINWSLRPPLTPVVTQQLTSITGRLGAYVAVGQTGTILISPDSVTWTRVTLPGVTQNFYNVSLLTGQFIAVGDAGRIYTSPDGTDWTNRTTATITNNLRSVTFNGSQFILTTDGERIVVTADFATFLSRNLSFNLNTPRWASTSANGLTVAVGQGGEIATTPDGLAWTQRGGNGTMQQLSGVSFLNNQWFAVGSNTGIFTSSDAVTWTRLPIPAANSLNAIGYGAGRYVAIGDGGYITSSLDGDTWVGNTTASGTGQSLRGIAYANGRWIVVGAGGVIRTSTNGTTWTTVASGITTGLNALTTFGSTFIAIGDSGVILTSVDGLTWTPTPSGTTQSLRAVCVDRGTAYIVGFNRTVLASTDAQTWTPRTVPGQNNTNPNFRGVTAANGGLFIVGDQGVALFSPDSVTWSYLPPLAYRESLVAVASNGISSVIVASGGTILQAYDTVAVAAAGAPAFANPVPDRSLIAGGFTSFVATPTGAPPFTYQWLKNGNPIPGATNDRLSFTSAQSQDNGAYSAVITNSAGSATSNAATLSVTPLPDFAWRNPVPSGGTLQSVAYAGGRFVAVGTGSRVLTSPDGIAWTPAATVPTAALLGVASDGNQWVAVGFGGALFNSIDTTNWIQRNPSTTVNLRGVASTSNGFIACGDSGTVTTSFDGVTWTARNAGTTQTLNAVAHANGRYVAVGNAGTLVTSTDAVAWTRIPLTTATGAAISANLLAVSFLNGQFVAAGNSGVISASNDGVTWTARTSATNTNNILGLAYNGTQYVFVTDGDRVVVSPNLTTYTNITIPAYNVTVPRFGVAAGAGVFVTVGAGGEISTAPDGVTWTARGATGARWVNYDVAYVNNRWMAVGSSGGVLTSPDGATWTRQTTPNGTWMRGCTFGAGRYVVVGDTGWIISSTDSVTWAGTQAASTTTQNFTSVAFANGRFVAVGNNGTIVTSTNGTTWAAAPSGTTQVLQRVAAFRGRFYAVGNTGTILVSDNGTTWSALGSGTTQILYGLGSDGTTLYVVGSNRTILSSTDGTSWIPSTAPALGNGNYRGIARSNGGWTIVGDQGVALFSIDGLTWVFLPTVAAAETMNAIASNAFSTVATGFGGSIIQAINPPFGRSRLTNVATRGLVQPGGTLTPGFVLRGTGSKNVVVRAVGPTLSAFGLAGLADLKLEVVNQQTQVTAATNDDWGGSAPLSNAFASLGAFALTAASKDAAVQATLPVNQGGYSVKIAASGTGTTGVALAEVYDADNDSSPVRVINVSTLGYVGTGENVLTPGFVIRGTGAKSVLIRAVGPGLAQLGVGGLLDDPQFSVFPSGSDVAIATSNDWGGTAALKAAFAAAGAFNLAADNSKDAAIVLTLPPGGYTVVTSGVGSTTGTALVEVYDLDP